MTQNSGTIHEPLDSSTHSCRPPPHAQGSVNGVRATLKSLRGGAGPQVAYDEEPETSI